MNQNIWRFVCALCGVAVVIAAWLIKRLLGCKNCEFDERQVAARGKAYQYAFVVTAFAELIYACLEAGGVSFADPSCGPLLGVLLGVTVFGVTAIVNDAYVSPRESSNKYFLLPVLMIAALLLRGIPKLLDGEAVVGGKLTMEAIPLAVAAVFVIILITGVIHWIGGRRSGKDGGDE